ncbi:choline kinase, putative [Talaromyces stipitatus ATCC 10500]|uniref:Choline kinase, putative n=1 Tax=Talaromyces stipitatus (strain ATCC 10500 / CBS 375.48 / QM 6759 / NRRL 1006) TaxID=441959 RepID=B8M206_TALSN|nr:choline kinase, putative [Talaromyces stipitatus ATCC 10500]EED21384.1 choline kinase, putative [Talaromyces stipitatus ATCC 10500]
MATKQFKAPIAKRITARSPILHPSPAYSLHSQMSSLRLDAQEDDDETDVTPSSRPSEQALFNQVLTWLHQEQSRQKSANDGIITSNNSNGQLQLEGKRHSVGSEKGLALDQLESILQHYAATTTTKDHASPLQHRRSKKHRSRPKGLRRGSGSESDYFDDSVVPSVDAMLDNSKTLAYSGGAVSTDQLTLTADQRSRYMKDQSHWLIFKSEILRLIHTLRLKGWRRVSMEDSSDIEVTRLSGALTNAVYVVKPPPPSPPTPNADGTEKLAPRRPPPKLLLRIYGPQVEHLIDRDGELQILRRLGKKNIGPRVLGTFKNGRFEEFFNAHPLTPQALRNPQTSRQIAKRMRELHDGVELLEEERLSGPAVFRNWDKWVDRCEQVISWLDKEILTGHLDGPEPWRKRGLICGVPWATFRKAVENYRIWLFDHLGGIKEVKRQLVFAHNDTQYGNLLRLEPEDQSPLLLPANSHKQLVVIDFEYSSANTPALEFANHFTEWCYNYHDAERPWACNTRAYPTPEEQHRFISAYVYHHRPQQQGMGTSPLATPDIAPSSIPTPRLAPFSLDAPAMSLSASSSLITSDTPQDRVLYEETFEAEIQQYMRQTRLWRVANSAQWVAWGIVQAKVAALEEEEAAQAAASSPTGESKENTTVSQEMQKTIEEAEESEFDYLAYSQDRALFFWADVLSMSLIRENELPDELLEAVKQRMLNY